ncbi:hypothetical protein V6U89_22725 [Micromonospora sp. CPCC 206171]|uniref:hypothetical protein n=1 Tax=Micromonospora sp. CPCC 206171 TaxID=3122405 RepID=UPI002FF3AAE6
MTQATRAGIATLGDSLASSARQRPERLLGPPVVPDRSRWPVRRAGPAGIEVPGSAWATRRDAGVATATEAILDDFAARERGERPVAAVTSTDGRY